MKNPLIPAGIEPAAFRFVAQHLNHCATAVPHRPEVWGLNLHYTEMIHDGALHRGRQHVKN